MTGGGGRYADAVEQANAQLESARADALAQGPR